MIDDNSRTGKNWTTKMIGLLQEIINTMWDHRNKCLHENEDKKYVTKETELLNRRVHDKYDKGVDGLHPDYCDVFIPTKVEVKKYRIEKKKKTVASNG